MTDVTLYSQDGLTKQSLAPSKTSEKITRFSDLNTHVEEVPSSLDPSFDMATSEDADLATFFARPMLIDEMNWNVNAALTVSAYPIWARWAKNPRVANRLSNFKNFRGTLHVKFLINGNQFYWGRAIAAYTPYSNEFVSPTDSIQMSQRPHVWLDPSTSTGGEMRLPFFHQYNAIDTTILNGFETMGTLDLKSVTALYHPTSTTPVSIHIYAWATDVVLSAPTNINLNGLVAQDGEKSSDEYGTGPISKPASMVASMAGKLSSTPTIGPYAMATQTMANAVGKVAAMFGYSRPAVISEPCLNKPLPIGNLVNVDAPDTSIRMALTSKQEVTVDPRTTGLDGVDELTLDYLFSKESYLTQFAWEKSDVTGTTLFSTGVSPINYYYDGSAETYQLTPMALAANPFRYWMGSITYRFQIVASGYHKGRLKFTWDPVEGVANPETNVSYNHIVDIAEERDFELTVGWGSNKPALNCPDIAPLNYYLEDGVVTADNDLFNGVLMVNVVNDLVSSGVDTFPVRILVSVKSYDLHVFAPDEERIAYFSIFPNPAPGLKIQDGTKSGIIQTDANQPKDPNDTAISPEGDNIIDTMGPSAVWRKPLPFVAGEEITSFRQFIKRYSQHSILAAQGSNATTDAGTLFIHKQPAFPYYYGYDPLGVDLAGANPFNRCSVTLLNWLGPCYAGWRGSLRWKLVPISAPCCSWMMEAKRCGSNCSYEDNWVDIPTPTLGDPIPPTRAIREAIQYDVQGGWDGLVVTSTQHNPVLEFEIPYYNNERFIQNKENQALTSSDGMGWWFRFTSNNVSNSVGKVTQPAIFNTYVAAGEDFSFYFFVSVPVLVKSIA